MMWVCARPFDDIAGAWSVVTVCCVLWDRGLRDGPIPRSKETYGMWCVCVLVNSEGDLGPGRALAPKRKKKSTGIAIDACWNKFQLR